MAYGFIASQMHARRKGTFAYEAEGVIDDAEEEAAASEAAGMAAVPSVQTLE